jgi:small GTP-binding protein
LFARFSSIAKPHALTSLDAQVVMLGDTNTGKTSLVLRFVEGYYKENRAATIGAFFLTKRLTLDKMTCKLLLWDTAGQEQFQRLAVTYYKQAAAAIVCFDLSGSIADQIPRLQGWLEQVQHNVGPRKIVIYIVGCKADLPITTGIEEQAKQIAERYGAFYMKTSAKNDYNVSEVFNETAEAVMKCQLEAATGRGKPIPVTVGGISLRKSPSSPGVMPLSNTPKSLQPVDPTTDDTTAGDSDEHMVEDNKGSKAPKIMCENGLLLCGQEEGSNDMCIIS